MPCWRRIPARRSTPVAGAAGRRRPWRWCAPGDRSPGGRVVERLGGAVTSVLTCSGGCRRSIRSRVSSTTQPWVVQRTGLRSASTSSGTSPSSRAKRRISSRSAWRSSAGAPRNPSSCVATPLEASISSSASMSVAGGRWNATVSARPAWRPPRPTAITGPRSGSLKVPTSASAPGATSGWTIAPVHCRPDVCTRRSSSRQPDRTAASPSSPSSAASISLACAGAAKSAFSATGPPISRAAGDRALEIAAAIRGDDRDSVRGQQCLRVGERKPAAGGLAIEKRRDQ